MSGGIESTCVAYWKRPDLCVTIDYGHVCASTEINTSSAICGRLGIKHIVIRASAGNKFGILGGRKALNKEKPEYWPFRNQFLGTLAAMTLQEARVREIWFGIVKSDRRFLDSSSNFIKKLDKLTSAQEGGIRIRAPAITLSTEKLMVVSKTPRSILGATFSCHRSEIPCGDCPGCWKQLRLLYSAPTSRSGPLKEKDFTSIRRDAEAFFG